MKLLYCERCADLVAPHPEARTVRHCRMGCSAVWWDDPEAGRLAVWAPYGPHTVSVVGLHNDLLREPLSGEPLSGDPAGPPAGVVAGRRMQEMLDDCPAAYLFRTLHSLVIRFRVGYTGDTRLVGMDEYRRVRLGVSAGVGLDKEPEQKPQPQAGAGDGK